MGLFSKKGPCPICGGKISFLATKIEGEPICDTCSGKIDMQDEIKNELTISGLQEYLQFYDRNQLLREKFIVSEKIDFGLMDTKLLFDTTNRLFCMSKKLDKTIFEGAQLKSFTIKEDSAPLFEGSAAGIRRYVSTVPDRAMAMAPQIAQFMMNQRLTDVIEDLDNDKENNRHHSRFVDIPEPFQEFNVELEFDHPYWHTLHCDMSGPNFSNNYPDVNDYLRDYQRDLETVESLVRALKTVAFPDAPEQNVGAPGSMGAVAQPIAAAAPPADTIGEIKKFKALMEEGVITREEFDAKKKQLMGI